MRIVIEAAPTPRIPEQTMPSTNMANKTKAGTLRKLGSNMDMLGGHLSDDAISVSAAMRYLHVGEQLAKDTLERLAERGIASRNGSMTFKRGPSWVEYAEVYNWSGHGTAAFK